MTNIRGAGGESLERRAPDPSTVPREGPPPRRSECRGPGGACFEFRLKEETERRIKAQILESVRKKLERVDLGRAIREERVLDFQIEMDSHWKAEDRSPVAKLHSFYRKKIDSKFKLLDGLEMQSRALEEKIRQTKRRIGAFYQRLRTRNWREFRSGSQFPERARERFRARGGFAAPALRVPARDERLRTPLEALGRAPFDTDRKRRERFVKPNLSEIGGAEGISGAINKKSGKK